MKKLFLLNALLLFTIFSAKAQPFQETFVNSMGYSCDHYSSETFPEGDEKAYAFAGTFFDGPDTYMHVFTTDLLGIIQWEQYINLGGDNGRLLDVTVGSEYSVAVTGFIEVAGVNEVYAALYDGGGSLINDFQYGATDFATGNNIIYSSLHDQFMIGGFESAGLTLSGEALLIALDGSFNYQWATNYNAVCEGFGMSVINDILEVNEQYCIIGNVSNTSIPVPYGQSQVLIAMVDNVSGVVLDNESFIATNTLGGQQAMGVSGYFNESESQLILLYNVSVSPTIDENRPYINIYEVVGVDLNWINGFRVDDIFPANPTPFVSVPSFTSLKIIPNKNDNTYLIFGMLDAYGQLDDRVLSVFQEIDLTSGTLVGPAKTWQRSEIPTGFPAQGGFFSLFDPSTLSTDVYTPETTTLSQDKRRFVSILPTRGTGPGNFSYDIISSTLNTGAGSSSCIDDFEMDLKDHELFGDICLNAISTSGSISAPLYAPITTLSSQSTTCIINNSPALGNSETDVNNSLQNELTLFANPAHDMLSFSISEIGVYNLIIMNMEGQVLIRNNFTNTGSQNQINIEDLATGVYVLTAINDKGQLLKKQFVKQ
ncbi:MAG: T9SS type A sorting domain-containing protein [Crocinitomix sp.]|nr:T9SS type A sorting domain-containing protein [Crocinitomix sp.]